MQHSIKQSVADVIRAAELLNLPESLLFIETVALRLSECFSKGGKVLIAGNGGSLCDAMHFAEELTGQFRHFRPALGAIALSDPSHMSCVANDTGFDFIFSRSVEALGREGDILILLSTSGLSRNVVNAALSAKEKGMQTIAFLGKSGGVLKGVCDVEWIVSGFSFSDRIQEAHMAALHIIVEMIEKQLFYSEVVQENSLCRN